MTNPAPKKPRSNRPQRPMRPASAPVNTPFSESLADTLGDGMAAKLRRHVEDNLKRKIKEAQANPQVQKASEKYGQ
jgi:hypothetical protein